MTMHFERRTPGRSGRSAIAYTCMATRLASGLAFFVLAIVPRAGASNCLEKEVGWLWDYEGTIGSRHPIRATLTVSNGEVTGVYFYVTQLKDIHLEGRVIDDTRLVLDELSPDGKVEARFEGEYVKRDPRGKLKGELSCEILVGSWKSNEGKTKLPFALYLKDQTYGTLEHRYSLAGASDDFLINSKAKRFRDAVIKGDKRTVASAVRYPIQVKIAGHPKTIRTARELISEYDLVFSPEFKKSIATAIPHNMFVRDVGIMLGNGEVWFGPKGDVIAINNW